LLLCLGILVILSLTFVPDINFFFDGWWSLFIIIPCTLGLFTDKKKTGPLFGIGIGVLLLLSAQGVIEWADIWKYMLAFFAIIWGFEMIFGKGFACVSGSNKEVADEIKLLDKSGRRIRALDFSFGSQTLACAGQDFEGADIKVAFGHAKVDLRGANILDGAVVTVNCSFGGAEIIVDPQVAVKVSVNSSFGGVENKKTTVTAENSKTIYVEGNCSFGGIEIK